MVPPKGHQTSPYIQNAIAVTDQESVLLVEAKKAAGRIQAIIQVITLSLGLTAGHVTDQEDALSVMGEEGCKILLSDTIFIRRECDI